MSATRPNVRCPACRKVGPWFESKYGPFCSHRCKLVDLGKWLSEENRISEPLRAEHLDQLGDAAEGQPLDDGRKRNDGEGQD